MEGLPLAELKKKIKEFKTTETPKLSSKKSVLTDFATKVGILKKKDEVPSPAVLEKGLVKAAKEKPLKADKPLKALKAELPVELKTPLKKSKKEELPETPKKKGSPFSAFMAAHKGEGLGMAQLAAMYRGQK